MSTARLPTRVHTAMAFLLAAISLDSSLPARAQGRRQPDPPPEYVVRRAVLLPDGRVARLRTALSPNASRTGARIELPDDVIVPLHQGSPVSATVEAGHGGYLIALAIDHGGAASRFEVRHVAWRGGVGGAATVGEARAVARQNPPAGSPFGVAATATPDGFAVFFQELDAADPTLARTFLAQVAPDGTPRGPAVEIPVPWGVAAAAWNGAGYHLALIYPGDGMRLSMVSLDTSGRPQQHPDWASAAGVVADVHLVAEGGRVHAYYRGGPLGEDLLEADVSQIRGWGSEPPPARRVSALAAAQLIGISLAPDGERARAVH